MPIYSNTPPTDPRGRAFQIVRTPTGKPLVGIITSEDLVGCYTHFWQRRTMPCERDNCEACGNGIPFRWHCYQSAYLKTTHLHCIFECTAQAAEQFVEYREAHGTIRGCLFTASRMNYAPNARIIITTRPANLAEIQLPKPPDICKVLAILWNLPIPDVRADRRGTKRGQKTIRTTPPTDLATPKSAQKIGEILGVSSKETLSDVGPRDPAE